MLTIIGLIALLGAVAVGVAGIQANSGETLPGGFTVFGQNYSGSSGALFGYGMIVGAIGALGLILLLTAVWTASRRGSIARRELRQTKRQMAARPAAPAAAAPAPVAPAPAPARAAPPDSKPTWSFNRFMNRPPADKSVTPAHK
ncbi:hypothetical protein HLB23_12635 [Nocardia uniformis]|uniref:Uncharacterized protein n=1 Tax=Nocardia uniformis TaxID=53432 RepID=A0A849CCG8_9NOCA|nr:hypothetical protein [Nocardia uniformis]NNH70701.1 hypothetical protein [Nocardia uniformis]